MKQVNEKLRSRMQLSRALFSIVLDVETILNDKSDDEREALRDTIFKMVPRGAMLFAERVKDGFGPIEDTDTDRFITSPHGVSFVDALLIAIEKYGQLTLSQQAELFASLAGILVEEIPFDIRWAVDKEKDLEIEAPMDMIGITVQALDAMYAIQEAWNRIAADPMSNTELATKVSEVISEKARANGSLAHVRNRELKASVFEWCEANLSQYKSMDQAAEAIAGVEIPRTFTTVRSWIREWKKNNSQKGNNGP